MSVLAEFSIVPVGSGASVSGPVARAVRIAAESGLPYAVNSMGTIIEGEWDAVMAVIARCHAAVAADSERVLTNIRIDDYRGRNARLEQKIASLEKKLGTKLHR